MATTVKAAFDTCSKRQAVGFDVLGCQFTRVLQTTSWWLWELVFPLKDKGPETTYWRQKAEAKTVLRGRIKGLIQGQTEEHPPASQAECRGLESLHQLE